MARKHRSRRRGVSGRSRDTSVRQTRQVQRARAVVEAPSVVAHRGETGRRQPRRHVARPGADQTALARAAGSPGGLLLAGRLRDFCRSVWAVRLRTVGLLAAGRPRAAISGRSRLRPPGARGGGLLGQRQNLRIAWAGVAPEQRPRWPALPHTARETDLIAAIWPGGPSQTLRGAQASETSLHAAMPGKRDVHLATHGFFADPHFRSLMRHDVAAEQLYASAGQLLAPDATVTARSPLLLSGLALSGANRAEVSTGGDDGILTGEETLSCDLTPRRAGRLVGLRNRPRRNRRRRRRVRLAAGVPHGRRPRRDRQLVERRRLGHPRLDDGILPATLGGKEIQAGGSAAGPTGDAPALRPQGGQIASRAR